MSETHGYEELLVAKGTSLEDLGLRDVALARADALLATELLAASSVPILGGDVYFMRGEAIEQAFANWHTDQRPGESRLEFAERSCRHSAKYIAAFPDRPDVIPLFVFVVSPGGE